jgi:tRNA dimethylallyltransferase
MSFKDKVNKLIIIVGPTASGKTTKAIEIAKQLDAEIFSADSRQIYKELNIGVARPSEEELKQAKHHFIASHSIHKEYTAGAYELEMIRSLDEYFKIKDTAILCGGTGLYIESVVHGLDDFPKIEGTINQDLDQELAEFGLEQLCLELKQKDPITFTQIDLKNSRRVLRALSIIRQTSKPFSSYKFGEPKKRNFETEFIYLNPEREALYQKINLRVDQMIDNGLLTEVQNLFTYQNLVPLQTVGYQELFDYLNGKIRFNEAIDKIKQHSRNYAKRQVTWFNKKVDEWQALNE